MKISITITWSKLMALVFQALAFVIDMKHGTTGTTFMFCVPFTAAMIMGKQFFDSRKNEQVQTDTNRV